MNGSVKKRTREDMIWDSCLLPWRLHESEVQLAVHCRARSRGGFSARKDISQLGLVKVECTNATFSSSGENIRDLARGHLLLVQGYGMFLMPTDHVPELHQLIFFFLLDIPT